MSDVRFVRIHGKVVPIRQKGNGKGFGSKTKSGAKPHEVVMKFKQKNVSTEERAKSGAKAGAVVGGIYGAAIGAQFGLKGLVGGAIGGAAGLGALSSGLNAAFGARKATFVSMQLQKLKKKNKTGL
jgi:uncharacterized membrane protein